MNHIRVAADVLAGEGAARRLGSALRERNLRRPLLVGGERTRSSPIYRETVAGLREAGLSPHEAPPRAGRLTMMHDVEALAALMRSAQVDVVIGVGGGSVLDLAKVGTIVAAEGAPAERHAVVFEPPDRVTIPPLRAPKLPVVAVPTTFSGSEGNGSGQIRGGAIKFARSFRDDAVIPSIVVLDPIAGEGQSVTQAVSSAFNAAAHCVTALAVRQRSPFSDALAAWGFRLVLDSLPALQTDPAGDLRVDAQWGSLLAGWVLRHAYAGMHHAINHAVVTKTALSHATSNALVLPHAIGWHLERLSGDDLMRLQAALPADWRNTLAGAAHAAGLPPSLREAGVPEESLGEIVAEAMHDRAIPNELLTIVPEDVELVLRRAWA